MGICERQRRQWHPIPVLLPGKSHGWRSLVGCSPWGHEELDTTEWLHFHFSLSCVGEGNGTPLQCSCLENPRDGGAWWAAVYGVTQSQTWLKWLSKVLCWFFFEITCRCYILFHFHWRLIMVSMAFIILESRFWESHKHTISKTSRNHRCFWNKWLYLFGVQNQTNAVYAIRSQNGGYFGEIGTWWGLVSGSAGMRPVRDKVTG